MKGFNNLFGRSKKHQQAESKPSPNIQMSTPNLEALVGIISQGVAGIQAALAQQGGSLPTLDDPMNPEAEALRDSFAGPAFVVTSAAYQLIAALANPNIYVGGIAMGVHSSTALTAVEASNVPEILREAGPAGMHIKDISDKSRVEQNKLGRLLRLLATQYIFKEVAPDVFANNRLSSVLDTGKSLEVIKKLPAEKWDNAAGLGCAIGHCGDEITKSAAYLSDYLTDPDESISHSQKPNGGTFQYAYKTKETLFEWFERPENPHRLKRFGATMKIHGAYTSAVTLLQGFDWGTLPQDSVVVDVGGGIGTSALTLAGEHKHLQYVVQDRKPVVEEAEKVLKEKTQPGDNLVIFQGHDFFTEQPVKNATVFLLRLILHDWTDKYSAIILDHLHKAATPDTKLMIIDAVIDYACPVGDVFGDIPGAAPPPAPAPLLANFGLANLLPYQQDMMVLNGLNAGERTAGQFKDLLAQTGWKLEKISRLPPPNLPLLVAVPI